MEQPVQPLRVQLLPEARRPFHFAGQNVQAPAHAHCHGCLQPILISMNPALGLWGAQSNNQQIWAQRLNVRYDTLILRRIKEPMLPASYGYLWVIRRNHFRRALIRRFVSAQQTA